MSSTGDSLLSGRDAGQPDALRADALRPDAPRADSMHAGAAPAAAKAHVVQFYESADDLEKSVARFVADGLSAAEAIVVIATAAHERMFRAGLESRGFDVERACAGGQLVFLDAVATLSRFMRDGEPDPRLFEAVVGDVIAERIARAGGARTRAYGEMVDVLWQRGERTAAVRLQELWNELQTRQLFTLLCASAVGGFYKEPTAVHSVCEAHTHVVGGEGVGRLDDGSVGLAPNPTEPPPQYAETLAREIAHREQIEQALRESLRQLRRKEEELLESEEQLRDFLENGTVGLHRVGPDGRILWANRAELEMLGYAADEYIGRPIADFHVDKARIADILARVVSGETLTDIEARLRAKDGSIRHVVINSSGYFRDGRFVHTRCFSRDVTERLKAEDALRASARELQLITDALPICVSYIDRDTRYRFVSAAYESWFGRPKNELTGRRVEEIIGPAAYEIVAPLLARALAGEAVAYTGDVPNVGGRTRSVEATYLPQFGEGSGVVGLVAVISDVSERKAFDRFRAAAAVRAERLARITAALADAVTAEEVFEALVDSVAAAVGASSAALWLVGDDGRTVKLARAFGYTKATSEEFDSIWLDSNPSIPAIDAIRRGEPIWIPSQDALLREYPHLRGAATSGRSYRVSCLPLVSRDRTLGALGLTIEGDSEAPDDERDFLLLVARYAGQALERLRLLDAERRSRTAAAAAATRMGVLSRASRTFGHADLDLDQRVDDIVREVGSVMSGCVGLSLIERDGRLHTCAVYHPLPEAKAILDSLMSTTSVALGEGITGRVAHTGESRLLAAVDPRDVVARAAGPYREFLERFPAYAMVCVPLRARGKVIGALVALRTRPGETYTREDLELFEELAERAAPAVENSRLHRENVAARARAEQLYHFAKSVVSAEKVEEVFESALDAIAGALGTDRGAILICDDAKVMRFRAWRHLSDDYRRAVEGHSPWAPDELAPKPVLVPDVRADLTLQPYAALFQQERIGSLAFIPLVTRGRLIGKFMVYYRDAHAYSTNEVELATAIASHLASVTARFAAISKLEETIRYNELFAGVLGHDLRSPLGAIITSAQLLLMRGEGRGDRYMKPISRVISSGQRMTRMIDQLLDLTRARAGGGIQVDPCDVDLSDLCAQAIGEIEVAYPSWIIERESVGDLVGSWDADRLLQIVSNLVSNAGQHGQAERPIRVRLDGSDPNGVVLEVHNEGVIPAPLIPTLFDPFRGTRQRGESRGLGLGLFIVKELAAAHAGAVTVASSPAEGTTFRVRLPRRAPRSPAR